MRGKIDIKGIDEFKKRISDLHDEELDKLCRYIANQLALRLYGKAVKNTPVITGNLRGKWRVGVVEQKDGMYEIVVSNITEYASYVEYGHRQRVGRYVPALGKRLKKPWVVGRFMLRDATNELDNQAPQIIENLLKLKLTEFFDGK